MIEFIGSVAIGVLIWLFIIPDEVIFRITIDGKEVIKWEKGNKSNKNNKKDL